MSNENSVQPFTILSAEEAWERFGDMTSTAFLFEMGAELHSDSHGYRIPDLAEEKRNLARSLTEIVTTRPSGLLRITHWWEDTTDFDEYRNSLGERRRLKMASLHVFSSEHGYEVEQLLGFVLHLNWDCFLFDPTFLYLIKISHDGYLKFASRDGNFPKSAIAQLARLNMEPLSTQVSNFDK
jgi:hypothetical protein